MIAAGAGAAGKKAGKNYKNKRILQSFPGARPSMLLDIRRPNGKVISGVLATRAEESIRSGKLPRNCHARAAGSPEDWKPIAEFVTLPAAPARSQPVYYGVRPSAIKAPELSLPYDNRPKLREFEPVAKAKVGEKEVEVKASLIVPKSRGPVLLPVILELAATGCSLGVFGGLGVAAAGKGMASVCVSFGVFAILLFASFVTCGVLLPLAFTLWVIFCCFKLLADLVTICQ